MEIKLITDYEKIKEAYNDLAPVLSIHYPEFEKWYNKKVLTKAVHRTHYMYFAYMGNSIAGYLIMKNTIKEKKICTLFVKEEFRKRGAADYMFKFAIETLKTETPIFSLPESLIPDYKKLLEKYSFKLKCIYLDYYMEKENIYYYNGYH